MAELEAAGLAGSVQNSEDVANAIWVASNTKKCPQCSAPIEKDEGCNHMRLVSHFCNNDVLLLPKCIYWYSCRKCRHEFCWICMQDWSLHNSNTGGHYQCNRFQGAAVSSNNPNPTEGNARHEALRLKSKGRQVAWFLHHFARFRAHSDSAVLEARMHKETVLRIADGLVRSGHNDLKWLQGDGVQNPVVSHAHVLPPAAAVLETLRNDFVDYSHNENSPRNSSVDSGATAAALAARSFSKEEAALAAPAAPNKRFKPLFSVKPNPAATAENSATSSITSRLASATGKASTSKATNTSSATVPSSGTISEPVDEAWLVAFEADINFLNSGFEELLRCRYVSSDSCGL
jgi:hypothetical protein